MCRASTSVLLALIFFEYVNALDVVAGKSGEEQVKEALERAQKESEEAARKDKQESISEREQLELKHFLKGRQDTLGNHALLSSDLANVLGRKVDELRKYTSSRGMNNNNQMTLEGKTLKHEGEELAAMKEDSDSMLERESDRKMVEMARKLNNLVQKFQRKIGRLSERNHAVSYLNLHPRVAAFLHTRRHPIPPMKYAQLISHLKGESSFSPDNSDDSQVKSIRGNPKKPAKESGGIDLMALKKALGLLHKGNGKGDSKNGNEVVGSKTSYKEDTKLEDRLAMEAEEEKKFSNSDSYEYGMGGGGGGSKSSAPPQATFSPKEQASKEMQSYNDLISSESNRELSQIQDEITKATQSSMGQVSVVGQKERVQTENPESPLGGIGSLDGIGSFSQESGGMMGGGNLFNGGGNPSLKGAIDSQQIGPPGSSETFPGSAAANEALESALQASATADMNGESMTAQQIQGSQGPSEGEQGGGQQEGQGEIEGGNQAPIEIGGSMQEQKQDMNAMSAGNNQYEGQGGNQMESNNQMMQMNGNNFMQEGGNSQS